MRRFWSFILITICFFNAVNTGAEFLFEEAAVGTVVAHADADEHASTDAGVESVDCNDHKDGDGCPSTDACTHCHLGHCPFTVSAIAVPSAPNYVREYAFTESVSLQSAIPSTLGKPPRA